MSNTIYEPQVASTTPTVEKMAFQLKQSPALTGLRGGAVLLVMLFHADVPMLRGGYIGVDIFFVLSGFLISSLLIEEFHASGTINIKHFYIRRLLRLAPAVLLLLAIFSLLSFLFLSPERSSRNLIDALIALTYMSNWARAFSIHPPDYLGHTWSLSIEEQFYIFWPLTLVLFLRLSPRLSHVAVLILAIALASAGLRIFLLAEGASFFRLYNGLDTRADALMIGCALAAFFHGGGGAAFWQALKKILVFLTPVAALGLGLIAIFMDWKDPRMYHFGFLLTAVMSAIVIADSVLMVSPALQKLLLMKWLVWTGSISYGLYLWHYPIYRMMRDLGANNDGTSDFPVGHP